MSSSHSTPSKAATAKSKSKASSSSRSSSRMFTPAMQDRQARNKDPYASTDESSDSAWEGQNRKFDVYELGSSLTPPYLLCLSLTRVTCSEFMRHESQDG